MINPKQGFTLIELLVVISIIGFLTSIALASLSAARIKAANTNIKSNLGQIVRQAAIVYSNTGSYNGLFTNGQIAAEAYLAAQATAGTGAEHEACADDQGSCEDEWYVWVELKPLGNDAAWCVDFNNTSIQIPIPVAYDGGGCAGLRN